MNENRPKGRKRSGKKKGRQSQDQQPSSDDRSDDTKTDDHPEDLNQNDETVEDDRSKNEQSESQDQDNKTSDKPGKRKGRGKAKDLSKDSKSDDQPQSQDCSEERNNETLSKDEACSDCQLMNSQDKSKIKKGSDQSKNKKQQGKCEGNEDNQDRSKGRKSENQSKNQSRLGKTQSQDLSEDSQASQDVEVQERKNHNQSKNKNKCVKGKRGNPDENQELRDEDQALSEAKESENKPQDQESSNKETSEEAPENWDNIDDSNFQNHDNKESANQTDDTTASNSQPWSQDSSVGKTGAFTGQSFHNSDRNNWRSDQGSRDGIQGGGWSRYRPPMGRGADLRYGSGNNDRFTPSRGRGMDRYDGGNDRFTTSRGRGMDRYDGGNDRFTTSRGRGMDWRSPPDATGRRGNYRQEGVRNGAGDSTSEQQADSDWDEDESSRVEDDSSVGPDDSREASGSRRFNQREEADISEVSGDLFSADSDSALAHCVAEDLRMGAGIAVAFRSKFGCVDDLLDQHKTVGEVAILEVGRRFVYYLITKKLSSGKPTMDSLRRSLECMKAHCVAHDVKKLAMPRIGCGLDRLDWRAVLSMLHRLFARTGVKITVYNLPETEPTVSPAHRHGLYVTHNKMPLLDIAAKTGLVYLCTASAAPVTPLMRRLDDRHRFMAQHTPKPLGEVVRCVGQTTKEFLYGLVVRGKETDRISYKHLLAALRKLRKMNDVDYLEYFGMEATHEDGDDVVMEKMITCWKLVFDPVKYRVELWCCWPEEMQGERRWEEDKPPRSYK